MTIKHLIAAAALSLAVAPLTSVLAEDAAAAADAAKADAQAQADKAVEETKSSLASGSETKVEEVKDEAGSTVKTIETTINNPLLKN